MKWAWIILLLAVTYKAQAADLKASTQEIHLLGTSQNKDYELKIPLPDTSGLISKQPPLCVLCANWRTDEDATISPLGFESIPNTLTSDPVGTEQCWFRRARTKKGEVVLLKPKRQHAVWWWPYKPIKVIVFAACYMGASSVQR